MAGNPELIFRAFLVRFVGVFYESDTWLPIAVGVLHNGRLDLASIGPTLGHRHKIVFRGNYKGKGAFRL